VNLSVRNITKVYRQASPEQIERGKNWYSEAHRLANLLDPKNPTRAAAVFAVLSPQTSWEINLDRAIMAYQGERIPGFGFCADKAKAILSGADPNKLVSGPKVISFWQTISDPTNPNSVVIDRHAFSVAAGKVIDNETRNKFLARSGNYEYIAELYRKAAKILSKESNSIILPSQVQAITWIVWRETRIKTAAANRRKAERGNTLDILKISPSAQRN
jgi:hypothetical protein